MPSFPTVYQRREKKRFLLAEAPFSIIDKIMFENRHARPKKDENNPELEAKYTFPHSALIYLPLLRFDMGTELNN